MEPPPTRLYKYTIPDEGLEYGLKSAEPLSAIFREVADTFVIPLVDGDHKYATLLTGSSFERPKFVPS